MKNQTLSIIGVVILLLACIAIIIFGAMKWGYRTNLVDSFITFITTANPSDGTLNLESEPHIDAKVGFQMYLPKGWNIRQSPNDKSSSFIIFDPSLRNISAVNIMIMRSEGQYDFSDVHVQDNIIELINRDYDGARVVLESQRRTSSTTIDLDYTIESSRAAGALNVSARVYFKDDIMAFIASAVSPKDPDAAKIKVALRNSLESFEFIPGYATDEKLGTSFQTINETKTYTSKRFGYSLKYPAQWSWETMISNDSAFVNDSIGFTLHNSDLRGPNKLSSMNFYAQDLGPKATIDSEVEIKTVDFARRST